MNSFEWNENKEILYDTINEYCIEEKIILNSDKQQYLNQIFDYYSQQKQSITSQDKLNQVNKEILSTFVNYTKNNDDYIKLKPREVVQEKYDNNLYSKEDILKQKQNNMQQKYDYIKDEFNKFNNNKPPEIDFREKNTDENENLSIDELIEREISNRKNEFSNINLDSNSNSNPIAEIPSKKVHFNNELLGSNTYDDNSIKNDNTISIMKKPINNVETNNIQLLESKIDKLQITVDNILSILQNNNLKTEDLSSNITSHTSSNKHI